MSLLSVGNIHICIVTSFDIPIDPKSYRDDEQYKDRQKFFGGLFPCIIDIAVIKKIDDQRHKRIEKVGDKS